jgi:hypothetical protein
MECLARSYATAVVLPQMGLSRRSLLPRGAMVYCGNDKISWKKFAVAVELFVEVETATHRLSEAMKKDPKFCHVPGWFEYVSALGASLLVEATGEAVPRLQTKRTLGSRDGICQRVGY